jgi:hypothetical protein
MRSRLDPIRTPRAGQPSRDQRQPGARTEEPELADELAVPAEHGRARIARLEDALALIEEGERELNNYGVRGEGRVVMDAGRSADRTNPLKRRSST